MISENASTVPATSSYNWWQMIRCSNCKPPTSQPRWQWHDTFIALTQTFVLLSLSNYINTLWHIRQGNLKTTDDINTTNHSYIGTTIIHKTKLYTSLNHTKLKRTQPLLSQATNSGETSKQSIQVTSVIPGRRNQWTRHSVSHMTKLDKERN